MQSRSQLTFWLNLTNNFERNCGGLHLFPKSHCHDIPLTTKNEYGHYQVVTKNNFNLFDINEYIEADSSQFEMFVVDSLTCHQSLHNLSKDLTRLTYIFRVSDIADDKRAPFGLDANHLKATFFEQQFVNIFTK